MIENKPHFKLSLVERLIILFYFISPFLYLVRLFFADHIFSIVTLRALEPMLMVGTLLCLLTKRIKVDYYSIVQFLILFWGVSIAIISKNQILDIIAGSTHFITGLLLYIYFLNLDENHERMLWFIEKIAYFVIFSIGIVVCCIYTYNHIFGGGIYLGLACQILMPVFFLFCYKKKVLLAIICFLLIVLSGKRGVLIALLLSSALIITPLIFSRYINLKAPVLLTFGSLCVIVFLYMGFADSVIDKLQFDSSKGLDHYSSGRYQEFISAINYWVADTFRFFLGAGFGFNYTYVYEQLDIPDVENYKNIHFSYINPLVSFGVYFGVLYLLNFFLLLLSLFIKMSSYQNPGVVYKVVISAFSIYACFVFNLFNEPVFWALLGSLSAYRKVKHEKAVG